MIKILYSVGKEIGVKIDFNLENVNGEVLGHHVHGLEHFAQGHQLIVRNLVHLEHVVKVSLSNSLLRRQLAELAEVYVELKLGADVAQAVAIL